MLPVSPVGRFGAKHFVSDYLQYYDHTFWDGGERGEDHQQDLFSEKSGNLESQNTGTCTYREIIKQYNISILHLFLQEIPYIIASFL